MCKQGRELLTSRNAAVAGKVLYLNIAQVLQLYLAQSKQPSTIQFGDRISHLHEIALIRGFCQPSLAGLDF